MMQEHMTENDVAIDTRVEEELGTPSMYRVVMHNDNYTTMEFVITVLVRIFQKNPHESMALMLEIHKKHKATVGVYNYDIAYTRVEETYRLAESFDFPLKCSIIPEVE